MDNIVKRWLIFCEPCSYKTILKEAEETSLVEQKRADIPGGSPTLDPVTYKTLTKKSLPQRKQFKCPKCGRGVIAKQLTKPYQEGYAEEDKRRQEAHASKDLEQRIADGVPKKREEFDKDDK